MAGVQWIRLDTTMFDNLKVLTLMEDKQYRALVTHFQAMTYSGRAAMAGYLPKIAVTRVIRAVTTDVEALVAVGLWSPSPGGWQINGWDEYQVSDEAAVKRSEKAQKAARTRWNKLKGIDGGDEASA